MTRKEMEQEIFEFCDDDLKPLSGETTYFAVLKVLLSIIRRVKSQV